MRRGESGAALLEAVIAVALAAMLAAAAGGIARFGLTTLERAGAASDRGAEALAIRRSLFDMLTRIDASAPGAIAFKGEPGRVAWRGVVPGVSGEWRSGFWRLDGAGLAISRCDGLDDDCAAEDEALAEDGAARFAYAGANGEWLDEWPPGPPPALIRVTIDAAGEATRILVAPRVRGAVR